MRAAAAGRRKSKSTSKPRPLATADLTTSTAPGPEPESSGSTRGSPLSTALDGGAVMNVAVAVALDGLHRHGGVQNPGGIGAGRGHEHRSSVQDAVPEQGHAQAPEKHAQIATEVDRS